ncbi:MAG: HAD family hydrolase [Eubacterium sp.]|nr:HAD family hydrolase [Eubacterium sp.]
MKKAVIFDVDGTLWDALSVITDSWNLTASRFPDVKTVLTPQAVEPYMGQTMDKFAALFPELSPSRAVEILEDCCKEEITYLETHPGKLYPGMRQTIEELAAKYELYIVSNCQDGYIQSLLKSCDLEEYFTDFECFGRTGQPKDRNISILMQRCDIDKAIYIGDTKTDQEAAEKVGIPFIFAKYGMGETEYSRFAVNSADEIPAEIRRTKYFEL